VNSISHLIISNSLDFSTDYVCFEFKSRQEKYLRLNRDYFADYKISVNPLEGIMTVEIDKQEFIIEQKSLKSVYYRAPVFLREINKERLSLQEQLYKSQWSAFIRNLVIFENARWMNNPVCTYKAENKALQLKYAYELGFNVPATVVTNCRQERMVDKDNYIVKSLDTAIFSTGHSEMFVYSNVVKGSEIKTYELNEAPVIIQEYVHPKVDLRVTVIADRVYSVKIVKNKEGINDDWRKFKDDVEFISCELPDKIKIQCLQLLKRFNLLYGAIDLAYDGNKYYFIEINPTGEWAWLVDAAGQFIYKDIVDVLIEGE